MSDADLTDAQWCFMDLLMRAKRKGVDRLNRMEVLRSDLPQGVSVTLIFGALTIPTAYVTMHGRHDFEITPAGERLFNLRFGHGANPEPTTVADSIICLPDQSHAVN